MSVQRVAAVTLALGLAGTSCATPASVNNEPTANRTIEVVMSDFAFSPARVLLRPGERVILSLKNLGTAEHEFMAGSGAMPGAGYMRDWLADAEQGPIPQSDHETGHAGVSVRVPPKGSATLLIVVPPQVGELEFGCFVADHYERGMRGVIVVDQGRAPNAVPLASGAATPSISGPTATPMPHSSGGMDDEVH